MINPRKLGKEIKCLPTRHCFPFFSVSVCFIFYFIHTLSRKSLHRQLVFLSCLIIKRAGYLLIV
ncbi:hypothetical protein PRABACTJOHN_01134 [Parabacteroides johnsonii DSM 18315]|uniref:Uncharacterized protein n=1 Tax=Parabacteroides johnsonii DSM 18315 TaxID=537006 RepID=B7B7Y4_9BACT|nr:hypothetical protein PRABACTJOHN_01134 [Parabacteroides johnsonii DSM 18315]